MHLKTQANCQHESQLCSLIMYTALFPAPALLRRLSPCWCSCLLLRLTLAGRLQRELAPLLPTVVAATSLITKLPLHCGSAGWP